MRFLCAPVLALALALPGQAGAMTACGAMLTNTVSATFGSNPAGTIPFFITYNATTGVLINCPAITVAKLATPTAQQAGQLVTFRISVSNTSPYFSAFNVVVLDRLPDNMEWAGVATVYSVGAWTEGSANTKAGPYGGTPASGQDYPYYLRWTLGMLGPGKSSYVEFQARIL